MLASTHYDLVLGVDIHIVMVPSPGGPVPTPVPMPFVGMVFDPLGLVVGAAINLAQGSGPGLVLINGQPATNCGTGVISVSPHLPAPGVAFAKGVPGNDAELFFGGKDVSVMGAYPVRLGDLALSCSDPLRLPTSLVLAVPKGAPVFILRPMVLDAATLEQSLKMRIGMKVAGKLAKGLARGTARAAGRFTPKLYERLAKLHPSRGGTFWSRLKCVFTGHPVDVVSGRLMTDAVDLRLRSAVPLVFERIYDSSRCDRKTPLGWGWSHSLERALWEERGKVVYLAADGREIEFLTHALPGRRLSPGQRVEHEVEHLTLRCEGEGVYVVTHKDGTELRFATHDAASANAKLASYGMGVSRVHAAYVPTDVPPPRAHWAWLRQVRNRVGATLEYGYDAHGRLTSVREGERAGVSRRLGVELTYNERGLLAELKRPVAQGHGMIVHRRFSYDADGHLVAVTDTTGASWRFGYAQPAPPDDSETTRASVPPELPGERTSHAPERTSAVPRVPPERPSAVPRASVAPARGSVPPRASVPSGRGGTLPTPPPTGRLLVEETDRNGVTFYFRYDGHGLHARCIRTWGVNPHSGETNLYDETLVYDRAARRTIVTNAAGHSTVYTYDAMLRVIEVLDPAGRTTKTTYDERHGEKTSETDALGRTTRWTYDDHGNVLEVLAPDEAKVTLEYNEQHLPVRAVDPNGHEWKWHHNRNGQLVRAVPPEGEGAAYGYDTRGELAWMTLPEIGRKVFEYDELGFLCEVVEPTGARTRVWHDALGALTKVRDAHGATVELRHDTEGRITERLLPLGLRELTAYDAEGNVTELITPTRHLRLAYGGYYQLIERTEVPTGDRVRYGYDFEGKLLSVTDELGHVHTLDYDPAGMVSSETNYDGVTTTYIRDAGGQLVRRIGANGENTTYAYDRAGRVTDIAHADGTRITYAYRADGALTSALRADPDGAEHAVHFERNALGQAHEEASSASADLTATCSIHRHFGPAGLLAGFESSFGATQSIERGSFGAVQNVSFGNARVSFDRDDLGREVTRHLPGGAAVAHRYDPLGRPTERTLTLARPHRATVDATRAQPAVSPTVASLRPSQPTNTLTTRLQWRGLDQLAAVADALAGLTSYVHDTRGRLIAAERRKAITALAARPSETSPATQPHDASPSHPRAPPAGAPPPEATPPDAVELRAMDAAGRIFRSGTPGAGRTYSASGQLLQDERGTTYTYDPRGRLARKTLADGATYAYRYTDTGDLLEVARPDHTAVRFAYDAFSRRVRKTVVRVEPSATGPNETLVRETRYVWSGAQLLHELHLHTADGETDPDIHRVITWHYEPGTLVPLAKEVRDTRTGETHRYTIVTDPIGTPTEMVDEAGALAWKAQLDVYGVPHIEHGTAQDCPHRFQGQYEDEETGLYYNRFRYYDPQAGQYITPDPIGLRGGLQPYGYVADPTRLVDPLGLAGCDAEHLEQFHDGAVAIVPRDTWDWLKAERTHLGREGGLYVTTRAEADRVMTMDRHAIKFRLGIPEEHWNGELVRVDIPHPEAHNLRMPTGKEPAANKFFRPGGFTSGGAPEAVIDPVPLAGLEAVTIPGT